MNSNVPSFKKTPVDKQPWDVGDAVVFRGDGEPNHPILMARKLVEFNESYLEQDTYSRGGVVERLEEYFAGVLGKEKALFVPTGTLANHLAIRTLCKGKSRVVVQEQSHLYNDSGDCATRLSSISLLPLATGRSYFTLAELKGLVDRCATGRVATPIGALMIESPVRRREGEVVPFSKMKNITQYCASQGIGTHLDGARLYMMAAATGVSLRKYTALFDTVYISLYKYFGAPYGAILAGTDDIVSNLYHERRMFGGGLSSAALAASLALAGAQGFEARFQEALKMAIRVFEQINTIENIRIETIKNGSNIFRLQVDPNVNIEKFAKYLQDNDIFVYPEEKSSSSALLTVNTTILRSTEESLVKFFGQALNYGT